MRKFHSALVSLSLMMVCGPLVGSAQSVYWQKVKIADSTLVTGVRFIDSLTGYALGTLVHSEYWKDTVVLLKTTDGGFHWTNRHALPNIEPLGGAELVYAGKDGLILAELKRGQWILYASPDDGQDFTIADTTTSGGFFSFWSIQQGVNSGYVNSVTSDGGRTWKNLPYSYALDTFVRNYSGVWDEIYAIDSLRWAILPSQTTDGFILAARTTDGGRTWRDTASEVIGWKFRLDTFQKGYSYPAVGATGIALLSNGTYPVLTSNDLGQTWTPTLTFPPVTIDDYHSAAFHISGIDTLIVLGWDTLDDHAGVLHIWRSSNHGQKWKDEIAFSQRSFRPSDLDFLDSAHGWVVGDSSWTQASALPEGAVTSAFIYIYRPHGIAAVPSHAAADVPPHLFPNPATSEMTVEEQGWTGKIEIRDALGRRMTQVPIERRDGALVCKIASLPVGVYFIRIGSHEARFVKESVR